MGCSDCSFMGCSDCSFIQDLFNVLDGRNLNRKHVDHTMRSHSSLSASGCYRCSSGDVVYDEDLPNHATYTPVKLKQFSETCNFLQLLRPLTRSSPFFRVKIESLNSTSLVSVGIADSHFQNEVHLGDFNGSIGYQSHMGGQCVSNHHFRSHIEPPSFGQGDELGVLVTMFGQVRSSILLFKNGRPVCSAYHYSTHHDEYFPTVTMEGGPLQIKIMWHAPQNSLSPLNVDDAGSWLLSSGVTYDSQECLFTETEDKQESLPSHSTIQSPLPLSSEHSYYEVEVRLTGSAAGDTASFIPCLVACGKNLPEYSSSLLTDCVKFEVNTKVLHSGDRIGWGICHPPRVEIGNTSRQPILCYFTFNGAFQTSVCYVEPDGGYYPLVAFTPKDFSLQLCDSISSSVEIDESHWTDHVDILRKQLLKEKQGHVMLSDDLVNSDDLRVEVFDLHVTMTLVEEKIGVHSMQYIGASLARDKTVFQVNIRKLNEDSNVCIGLAPKSSALDKYPGKWASSLGYHSRDGRILYENSTQANTVGHRFSEGDQVMIETCSLPHLSCKLLVRIWKNSLPVALRYVEMDDDIEIYPIVSLFGNGSRIICDLITPNRMDQLPNFVVSDPRYWCLPECGNVSPDLTHVFIPSPGVSVICLVCPAALSRDMQHFEITVLEDPSEEGVVPPMIALTTASPYDPPSESNFKLDILRFWPRNEVEYPSLHNEAASSLVKKGDNMGWGVVFPDDNLSDEKEQLVICYLTVNREVILTRALIQPPGGFFPTLVLPYGCNEVKFDFGALAIASHPFTKANVQQLYDEASVLVAEERKRRLTGEPLAYEHEKLTDLYKPLPVVVGGDNTPHSLGFHDHNMNFLTARTEITRRVSKSKTCAIL